MAESIEHRRTGMTLFSTETCIEGHACRMVLHEKEVECDVEYVNLQNNPNPIIELNPYGESPTLMDRNMVLYGSHVVAEYLDDRLPHPPLMPPDPVNRGRVRMMIYRCQRDWLQKLRVLDEKKQKPNKVFRTSLSRDLSSLAPYMAEQEFWLGEEFSLVDCFIAPLLWRLKHYGIELPSQTRSITQYANRIFGRDSFRKSLSDAEMEMQLD